MYLISYCIYIVSIGQMYLFCCNFAEIIQMYLFSLQCKFYCIYTLNTYFIHVFT